MATKNLAPVVAPVTTEVATTNETPVVATPVVKAKVKKAPMTPIQVVRSIIKNAVLKGKMPASELDEIIALATKMKALADVLAEAK